MAEVRHWRWFRLLTAGSGAGLQFNSLLGGLEGLGRALSMIDRLWRLRGQTGVGGFTQPKISSACNMTSCIQLV